MIWYEDLLITNQLTSALQAILEGSGDVLCLMLCDTYTVGFYVSSGGWQKSAGVLWYAR